MDMKWMLDHFEADPLEQESIRLTVEILKTCAVIAFALAIIKLVGV